MKRIFILSPADCGGARARSVRRPAAAFDLAVRLRTPTGAPLGEVFSFLSGLYFRGKLAYAEAYARPPAQVSGVVVITATEGLRAVGDMITRIHLERYAAVPIAADDLRYRRPLIRDSHRLAARLERDCEVVLLGSIATRKYLDILGDAFGDRLRFPRDFIGRGDMSRGALLLRCVAEGRELEYARVDDMTAALGRPRLTR